MCLTFSSTVAVKQRQRQCVVASCLVSNLHKGTGDSSSGQCPNPFHGPSILIWVSYFFNLVLYLFLKRFIYFYFVCMIALPECLFVHATRVCLPSRQEVVSHCMWVLRTKLESARAPLSALSSSPYI